MNTTEEKESRELWLRAADTYYYDRYTFRSFESLHVLNILYYERELCKISAELVRNNNEGLQPSKLPELRELLSGHAKAMTDLETIVKREALLPKLHWKRRYMIQSAVPESDDKAVESYCIENHLYNLRPGLSLDVIRRLLHRVLPNSVKYADEFGLRDQMTQRNQADSQLAELERGIWSDHQERKEQRNRRRYADSKVVDSLSRYIVAFLGGAALLIPMLVMTFRTSQTDKLITVCISVVVFGLLFAMGTKGSNQEVLGASAAYSAVMVVYIGYATQGSNASG